MKAALDKYNSSNDAFLNAVLQSEDLYATQIVPPILDIQKQLEIAGGDLAKDLTATKSATDVTLASASLLQEVLGALALLSGLAFAFLIGSSIANPIARMTGAMMKLAGGDKSVVIPARDGKDEIADMARAVDVFKQNMIKHDELAATQHEQQGQKEARQRKIEGHIDAFYHAIQRELATVESAAVKLKSTAEAMAATAEEQAASQRPFRPPRRRLRPTWIRSHPQPKRWRHRSPGSASRPGDPPKSPGMRSRKPSIPAPSCSG